MNLLLCVLLVSLEKNKLFVEHFLIQYKQLLLFTHNLCWKNWISFSAEGRNYQLIGMVKWYEEKRVRKKIVYFIDVFFYFAYFFVTYNNIYFRTKSKNYPSIETKLISLHYTLSVNMLLYEGISYNRKLERLFFSTVRSFCVDVGLSHNCVTDDRKNFLHL